MLVIENLTNEILELGIISIDLGARAVFVSVFSDKQKEGLNQYVIDGKISMKELK